MIVAPSIAQSRAEVFDDPKIEASWLWRQVPALMADWPIETFAIRS